MKSSQKTESEDKLPTVSLSEHAGLKHCLINVDAGGASAYKTCMKTALFQSFFSVLNFAR